MASIGALQLVRHLLRRAHHDAIRRNEDVEIYATAHEEMCELLGKAQLLNALCEFTQDVPGDCSHMSIIGVIGAAIGLPHPVILDFEAAAPRGVEPECSGDNGSIREVCG